MAEKPRRLKALLLLAFLVLPLFAPLLPTLFEVHAVEQNVAVAGVSYDATGDTDNRLIWYASSRYWLFYHDGTSFDYVSSTNGSTWSSATTIATLSSASMNWRDVYYDDTYFHLVWLEAGSDVYYRRGVPEADGSITWSAVAQLVADGNHVTADYYAFYQITADSANRAWIGVLYVFPDNGGWDKKPVILRNGKTDGTWSNASGFPHTLNNTADDDWEGVHPVPLTSEKVYVIWRHSTTYSNYVGKLWDGSWGSQEDVTGVIPEYEPSTTSWGDDIHIAYLNLSTFDVMYAKRDYSGGWETPELVQVTLGDLRKRPQITAKSSTSFVVVWPGYPTGTHIYYKERNSTGWGSRADCLTTTNFADNQWVTLQTYFRQTNGEVGIAWTNGTNPYNINFTTECDGGGDIGGDVYWPITFYYHTGISSLAMNGSAVANGTIEGYLGGTLLNILSTAVSGSTFTYYNITGNTVYLDNPLAYTMPDGERVLHAYAEEPPPINVGVTVSLECSEWLFAERFYDFVAIYQVVPFLDVLEIRFADGAGNNITAYYDYTVASGPRTWGLIDGQSIAELGQVTSSVSGVSLTVTFPIWVELDALDALDVDVFMRSNNTDGVSTGWEEMQSDYFNLYVLGGLAETETSGVAYRMAGGDIFEIRATNDSWIAVNSTWVNLQHFSTMFSIQVPGNRFENVSNGGTGVAEYWFLDVGMYVCDPSTDEFYRAWHGETTFYDGDTGADDLWTTLNTTWYQRETEVKEDQWNLAPEHQNTTTHLRMFLDLWFNQANASQMTGGRITPFFYGMNKDVEWGFMGDWHIEYELSPDAAFFDQLEDSSGSVISARQLSMMKVYFNLSRPATADEYAITLSNFETLEFRTTKGAMMGVPTPTFKTPRIPDTPGFDLFGFLGDLFGPVLNTIWEAMASVAGMAWDFLVDNIPYLGEIYGMLVAAWDTMWPLLETIWGHLLNLFTVLASLLELVTYPIRIVGDMWARLSELWEELGFDMSASAAIALVLVFWGMWVFVAITDGDWNALEGMARRFWAITSVIMEWSYKFVTLLIDILLKLAGAIGNFIPFT